MKVVNSVSEYIEVFLKPTNPCDIDFLDDAMYEDLFNYCKEHLDDHNFIYLLGYMYYDDKFVKQDLAKAVEYFKDAAKKGNVEAIFMMYQSYLIGEGVEKDLEKANYYLKLGAINNDDLMCYLLGLNLYHGNGINKDNDLAFKFVRHAAIMGNKDACLLLADFYKKGVGCEPNLFKYSKWMNKAK